MSIYKNIFNADNESIDLTFRCPLIKSFEGQFKTSHLFCSTDCVYEDDEIELLTFLKNIDYTVTLTDFTNIVYYGFSKKGEEKINIPAHITIDYIMENVFRNFSNLIFNIKIGKNNIAKLKMLYV